MSQKKLFAAAILLFTVGAACTLPFTIQTADNLVATAAAQTVQAWQTQNAPIQTQQPTWTALPTQTPYPTFTPPAPVKPAAPPTATPQPCNQAAFVSETIADGTKFDPGTEFTKSWRLKNIGTCTWNPNYKLVFFDGSQMSGPNSVKLDDYVAPGEKIDILVNLKSPAKAGSYTGYWKLQADDGSKFGQVYVQIKVPSATFAVTSVDLLSTPVSYNGACPKTFTIEADITTSAAGKVTYKWQRSDGNTSALNTVTFDSPDTETVHFDWDLNSTDTHWVKIYIDVPNHQWFGPIDIPVTCS